MTAATTSTQHRRSGKAADKKPLSKRQRLKQVNSTHKWPQQPRILNGQARAKAYIRVSGLDGSSQKSVQALKAADDLHSPEVRFGRLLASPVQRVRHAAVLQLQQYLRARCRLSDDDDENSNLGLSELDLLKLWKGLWHTLYMCDKAPVQNELCRILAQLLWCIAGTPEEDEYAAQAYMNMYEEEDPYDTMGRENDDEDDEMEGEEKMEKEENDESEDEDDENFQDEDELLRQFKKNKKQQNNSDDSDDDDDDDVVIQGIVKGADEGEDDDIEQGEDASASSDESDSEMKHCRGAHLASLFVSTFFTTVRREWGRMDKYRLDKFYTLIRNMIHQVYRYMALRHWNLGIVRLFNDAIYEQVLKQSDCNGLRYHVIDVSLHELVRAANEESSGDENDNNDTTPNENNTATLPLTEATFIDCLEPFLAMTQTGGDGNDIIQAKIVENVLVKFLEEYSVLSDAAVALKDSQDEEKNDKQSSNDNNPLLLDQVHVGTINKFIFDLASDCETTEDRYRKSLYDVHKLYARRIKERGTYEVALEAEFVGDDDNGDYDQDEEENVPVVVMQQDDNDEDDDEPTNEGDVSMEVEEEEEEEPPKTSKKKKKKDKKKKKKKDQQKADDDNTPDAETDDPKETTTPTKDANKEATDEAPSSSEKEPTNDEKSPKEGKKKKRKRKRKKAAAETEDSETEPPKAKSPKQDHDNDKEKSNSAEPREEEIVITSKEQQHAKKKKAKAAKQSQSSPSRDEMTSAANPSSSEKRVKFGQVNQARSYKASMKALRTANPKIPAASPELSILRRKTKSESKTSKMHKHELRKKAADYF